MISFVFCDLNCALNSINLLLILFFFIRSFLIVKVIIVIIWVLGKNKCFPFSFINFLKLFYLKIVIFNEQERLLVVKRSLFTWADCKLLIRCSLPWLLLRKGLKLLLIKVTGGICRGRSVCEIQSILFLYVFITEKSL